MKNREHESEDGKQKPIDPSSSPNLIGTLLDQKMEVRKLIGEGGNGVVYEAFHRLLEKTVAVKILNKAPQQNSDSSLRFKNEAQVLSTFDHENIVQFLAFSSLPDGRNYMVLERLNGETLAEKLKRSGPLKQEEAIPIFVKICKALEYAHEKHIIHRDLKPANIMLLEESDEQIAKLLDFGIFKALQSSNQNLTQTGVMLGTVNYMSPEQCSEKELDQRSDIYSLGCVMYEAMVGTPPMQDANELSTMHNHVNKPLLSVPAKYGISRRFADCILRCCEKDINKRIQTASSLFSVLEACQNAPIRDETAKKTPIIVFAWIALPLLIAALAAFILPLLGAKKEDIKVINPAFRSFDYSSDLSTAEEFRKADLFLRGAINNKSEPVLNLASLGRKCLQYKLLDPEYPKDKIFQTLIKRLSQSTFSRQEQEIDRLSDLAWLYAWKGDYDQTSMALQSLAQITEKDPATARVLRNSTLACGDVFTMNSHLNYAKRINNDLLVKSDNDPLGRAVTLGRELILHPEFSTQKRKEIAEQGSADMLKAFNNGERIHESRLAEFCSQVRDYISPKSMIALTEVRYGDLPNEDVLLNNATINTMIFRIEAFIANNNAQKALEYATALVRAVQSSSLRDNATSNLVETTYLSAIKVAAANPKDSVISEGKKYLSRINKEDNASFFASTQALYPVLYCVEKSHLQLWIALGPLLFEHMASEPVKSSKYLLKMVRDFQANPNREAQRQLLKALKILDENIERTEYSNSDKCEVYAYLSIKFPDQEKEYIDKACKKTSASEFLNKLFELSKDSRPNRKLLAKDYLHIAKIVIDTHAELKIREPEYQELVRKLDRDSKTRRQT